MELSQVIQSLSKSRPFLIRATMIVLLQCTPSKEMLTSTAGLDTAALGFGEVPLQASDEAIHSPNAAL